MVKKLLHGDKLTGAELENGQTGEKTLLELDGLFVSVGRSPATELFAGQLELDEGGYIVADESTRTNIPGVFAVGDVRTKAVRQIITAAGDGAAAAWYAEEYLMKMAPEAEHRSVQIAGLGVECARLLRYVIAELFLFFWRC